MDTFGALMLKGLVAKLNEVPGPSMEPSVDEVPMENIGSDTVKSPIGANDYSQNDPQVQNKTRGNTGKARIWDTRPYGEKIQFKGYNEFLLATRAPVIRRDARGDERKDWPRLTLRFHGKAIEMKPSPTTQGKHYFELVDAPGKHADASIYAIDRWRANLNFYDNREEGFMKNSGSLATTLRLNNDNIQDFEIELV